MFNRGRQRGFSLVELLIVLAIIGLIASILIPNLMDALQKARQKRTMADLRGFGTAWMAWMTDQHGAASAGAAKAYPTGNLQPMDYVTLLSYVRPTDTFFYAQFVPQIDAWGGEIAYRLGFEGNTPVNVFACAPARDRTRHQCPANTNVQVEAYLSTDYDQDIIWADGYFLRWPDGLGSANQ